MDTPAPAVAALGAGLVAVAVTLGLTLGPTSEVGASAPALAGSAAAEPIADPTPSTASPGTWSGLLRERARSPVDVRLLLTDPPAGPGRPRDAALEIPALACRYTGSVPAGASAVVDLRAATDPQHLCASRATVRLTALSDRAMRYELLTTCERSSGSRCLSRTASALLTIH